MVPWRTMRVIAAVVLAGCAFEPRAAQFAGADAAGGGEGGPIVVDAPPDAAIAAPDAPPDGAVVTHPANWWNAAWGARMQLTITNASTATMAQGYQVGLQLDLDAAPCAGSRDSVRIVYNNTTDLPRVIDEVGGAEWTWFPLQAAIAGSGSSTSYWLYCGNASPTAASKDPATVFDFWDDFSGTTLGAAWASQNTVSVANGSVTVGNGNSGIHSTATYGANTAIDFMASASAAAVANPYWWGGYQTDFSTSQPWIIWHSLAASTLHPSVYSPAENWNGNNIALDTAPHLYGVESYGTSGAWRFADVIGQTHTYATAMSALNIRLHNYQSGGSVSFDWARVRKAVSPPPTVAVGSVETY